MKLYLKKSGCPNCDWVKAQLGDLLNKVKSFYTDEVGGLTEAAMDDILITPCLVIKRGTGKEFVSNKELIVKIIKERASK